MDDPYEDVGIESLPPICAVAGFFVMNVAAMERVLYTTSVTLLVAPNFAAAENLGATKVISRMQEIAPRLLDGDELRDHLDTSVAALELRHALVHGILRYYEETGVFESQRPPRGARMRQQADPANPTWLRHRFTTDDLMEHARSARAVSRFVHERLIHWHEALRPHDTE